MRLPADATLIVAGHPSEGAAGRVAALLAAWRAEALPVVHVERDGTGEPVLRPFKAAALWRELDGIGATAVVVCGAGPGVPAAAEAAAAFGCHVFVAADACAAGDLAPIAAAEASSQGDRARLVQTEAVLAAASVAKVRQRREAARRG